MKVGHGSDKWKSVILKSLHFQVFLCLIAAVAAIPDHAPSYNTPAPTYNTPAPTPAPTYHAPAPTYATPAPTYTTPAPTYTTPAPTYYADTYTAPAAPAYHAPAPTYHAAPAYHAPVKAAYHAEPSYYPDEVLPYTYSYAVADDYSKAVFSADESSDGASNVQGSYSVNLPDGRVQHVSYHSNGYEGFVADVTYEGEAHYPTAPKYHAPAPKYHAPAPAYHTPAPKYISATLPSYQS